MTTIVVSVTVILTLAGLSVVIWSLITTRDKYFKEYKERKRND